MQRTAAELSQAVAVAPPPQLRADLLRAVSQVRPLPPVVDNVIALRRARLSRSVWQGLAAACLVLAIAAGGWGYSQHRDASRTTASPATPAASIVNSMLAQPDVKATTTAFAHGSGTVIYAKDEHKVVLIGRDMPAVPAGKTYQLWMLPATGKAVSAGTFKLDAQATSPIRPTETSTVSSRWASRSNRPAVRPSPPRPQFSCSASSQPPQSAGRESKTQPNQ